MAATLQQVFLNTVANADKQLLTYLYFSLQKYMHSILKFTIILV